MLDAIQKLEYRANAGISGASAVLKQRLSDRVELPLSGICGEKLMLTGLSELRQRAEAIIALYEKLPVARAFKETILLDAWSSATIEGARTTMAQVKNSFLNPATKDDAMVVNAVKASSYAYGRPISAQNIRRLWERVADGVCENRNVQGYLYRDGMVYIGSGSRIVHIPASADQLPALMAQWFAYYEGASEDLLLHSFAAHFYFVYLHPFCDGNGRTARILNAAQLYHGGFQKMRQLPLSGAINARLNGYYSSISDSETVLTDEDGSAWLDVSVFVSYMLDAFEQCIMDAALSQKTPTVQEAKLLTRMNKTGLNAEITVQNAAKILDCKPDSARRVLHSLAEKGYLTQEKSGSTLIFRLRKHFP